MEYKFIFITCCVLSVVLFMYPDHASLTFRVITASFDVDLWRGYYEAGSAACSCAPPFIPLSATVKKDEGEHNEEALFSYHALTPAEASRRRFCVTLMMEAHSLQAWLVEATRKVVSIAGPPWSTDMCPFGFDAASREKAEMHATTTASAASHINIAELALPFRVLREWKCEESTTTNSAANTAAATTVDLEYKIYSYNRNAQLAPVTKRAEKLAAAAHSTTRHGGLGPSETVIERERSRSLLARNVTLLRFRDGIVASGEEDNKKSADGGSNAHILPFFRVAAGLLEERKVCALRLLSAPELLFGRRGFPLWNVLADETLMVDIRRKS